MTQRRSEHYGVSSANVLAVFVDISSTNLPDDIQNAILLKYMNDDDYEIFVTGFQPSCMYCVYSTFCILLHNMVVLRDPPIMLKILPIKLCCTAQKLYLLCSNYAH